MAKKKKDKKDGSRDDAVESIRSAIERGLQISAEGAQATRERTRELVDEIASAAGRVRQSIDDMRVLDELRRLRTEVETLSARVAALERPGSAPASGASASAAKPAVSVASSAAKPAVSVASSTAKPAAARSRAKKATTTRPPAATKATTARSRAKRTSAAKPSGTS